MMRTRLVTIPVSFLILAAGCGPKKAQTPATESTSEAATETAVESAPAAAEATPVKPKMAGGTIQSKSGSKLTGKAWFAPNKAGVLELHVRAKGGAPGEKAVHLHEKGDCSADDASSAGGHFNPEDAPHGAPTADEHHAGDFGNMVVAEDGTGKLDLAVDWLTLDDGPMGVVGRALVVHEKADDLETQPTGDAGGRIGCAVIRPAKSGKKKEAGKKKDGHEHAGKPVEEHPGEKAEEHPGEKAEEHPGEKAEEHPGGEAPDEK